MIRPIALALACLFAGNTMAADKNETVRAAIKTIVPNAKIDEVTPSPVKGFQEVIVDGHILYVSDDGKYLIQGSLFDITARKDLTEARRTGVRKAALASLPAGKRIVFPAENAKHTLTVFTDIDCGYCRKLHQEMAGYNKLGITVEYLMFPRAGIGSGSYTKAVNVWCADDRNDALTRSKNGENVETRECDNPIAEHFQVGQAAGVTGTPALVTSDGTLLPGYLPPDALLERLESIQNAGKVATN